MWCLLWLQKIGDLACHNVCVSCIYFGFSIILGASAMGLVITYPLMKRFTYWPQFFLGMSTFIILTVKISVNLPYSPYLVPSLPQKCSPPTCFFFYFICFCQITFMPLLDSCFLQQTSTYKMVTSSTFQYLVGIESLVTLYMIRMGLATFPK